MSRLLLARQSGQKQHKIKVAGRSLVGRSLSSFTRSARPNTSFKRTASPPLKSNVSLRCRNSMQNVLSFVAKTHVRACGRCACAGSGRPSSGGRRATAAASYRAGVHRTLGTHRARDRSSFVAVISSAQENRLLGSGQRGLGQLVTALPLLGTSARQQWWGAIVTGGGLGPATVWYSSRWLTTEQYVPFPPVSSARVFLVGDQANHSFERTCLRHAPQFKR